MARIKGKTDKARRSMMLPTRIVPVGGTIVVGGVRMRAVVRPKVSVPAMVCSGCAMRSRFCDNYACSRTDRDDGMSIWFVEEGSAVQCPSLLKIGMGEDMTFNLDMSDDENVIADAVVALAGENVRFRDLLLDAVEDILMSMPEEEAAEWLGSISEAVDE